MKLARFLFSTLFFSLILSSSLITSSFATTPEGYKVIRKGITVQIYRSAPGYELTGDGPPSWMELSRLELTHDGEVMGEGYAIPAETSVIFPPSSFGREGFPDSSIRLCQENVNFYYAYLNGGSTAVIANGSVSKIDVVAKNLHFERMIDYGWSGAEGGYQIFLDLELTITIPSDVPDSIALSLTLDSDGLHECVPDLGLATDIIIDELPGPDLPGAVYPDETTDLIDPPCPEGVTDCWDEGTDGGDPTTDPATPDTEMGDDTDDTVEEDAPPAVDMGDKIPGGEIDGLGENQELDILPINQVNGGACSLQAAGSSFTQWFWIGAFLLGTVPALRRKK